MVKVLIGTDGSDLAVEAARRGLALLASPDEVTVAVASVADVPIAPTSGLGGPLLAPQLTEAAWERQRAEAEEAVERTVGALPTTAAVVARRVEEAGDAGPILCDLAGELGADVVVVGSRGRSGIRRAVLGSVSDHVVRNAPCPVLVVRATGDG